MATVDVQQFIPPTIFAGRPPAEIMLELEERDSHYFAFYQTVLHNETGPVGKRKYEQILPKSIRFDSETFEVIGLLQGEMSKTYRDMLTFANSEASIMKKVIDWFDEQGFAKRDEWNWYLRFNIPEPSTSVAKDIEERVVPQWIASTGISPTRAYNKVLTWTESTSNQELQNNGTLMIEHGNKIFVQTIQTLVAEVTKTMPSRNPADIVAYLRGIVAAEGCVNYRLATGNRRLFVCATKDAERAIFRSCFHKIGIATKDCKPIKDIIISQRENMLKLHDLRLMTLHPDKHARFLEMIDSYTETWHERRGLADA